MKELSGLDLVLIAASVVLMLLIIYLVERWTQPLQQRFTRWRYEQQMDKDIKKWYDPNRKSSLEKDE